ncbi:unnamed protein product [Parajaminaea phylloscopi]
MAASSRFSYPAAQQGGSSGGPAAHSHQQGQLDASSSRFSLPASNPANRTPVRTSSMMSTSASSRSYPLSPPPQSALPSQTPSSAASTRSRFSSSSFLSRTPSLMGSGSTASGTGGGSGSGSGPAGNANTTNSGSAPDLLDRPRDKTKNALVSASALSYLYAEMISYTQGRVSGIGELEKRLSLMGYHHGQRLLPLLHSRLESPSGGGSSSSSKNPKRETRLLPVLLWVHGNAWKALFGKAADSLERSTERSDEYMISTNVPTFSAAISVPKDLSQMSPEAYTAGIVEAMLDGMGFPARVTAHSVPTPEHPLRTTILIKLDKGVLQREEALGPA